ncbi:DUF4625 domain-containing protein [Reichenbachiella sp. MSK19-1]|uniref:DUF4625 domain-containing protein n=1 Tax=Reichenbachiella sp. MSK19-1 TaxID=1897631 RepID=UPI000E6CD466|nr:DUF4625 domain-containing protein [Reichenbachiella sp. MSK19-1]RJE74842.1 hypothetical protein BGP76_17095 [Reichenbachiella sp. MSK19-1]
MNKKLLFSIIVSAALVACESDDNTPDVTAPVIEVEEPESGEQFAAGGEIHAHGEVSDNEGLASYNITIHDDFDDHTHGRTLSAFAFDQSYVVEGATAEIDVEIDIDADATAGPYHFIVQAIDATGNSTSFADGSAIERQIWITNDQMPLVHFQDATGEEVEEYEAVVGETIQFYGLIEDQSGTLDHVDIEVGHAEEIEEHDHEHARVLDEAIFDQEFEVEGATSVTIQSLLADANIVVTQSDLDELEEGEHLYLMITALDEDGNSSYHQIAIHFD